MNARERRSRRRLDKRIALNAAKMQERPPKPQGGETGTAATHASTERVPDAPVNPFAEFLTPSPLPANKRPVKPVMPLAKPPPPKHPGQPASCKASGPKGKAEGGSTAGGKVNPTPRRTIRLRPVESSKSAGGKQPARRARMPNGESGSKEVMPLLSEAEIAIEAEIELARQCVLTWG